MRVVIVEKGKNSCKGEFCPSKKFWFPSDCALVQSDYGLHFRDRFENFAYISIVYVCKKQEFWYLRLYIQRDLRHFFGVLLMHSKWW